MATGLACLANRTANGFATGPKRILVTTDAGQNWDLAFDGADRSVSGCRRDHPRPRHLHRLRRQARHRLRHHERCRWRHAGSSGPSTGFTGWHRPDRTSDPAPLTTLPQHQFYAIKFSPTYSGDSSVALVYATTADAGDRRHLLQRGFPRPQPQPHPGLRLRDPGIEVKNPTISSHALHLAGQL